MANPQDPSVHRSRTVGSVAPDSIEGELEADDRPEAKGPTGPVPPGNRSPYDPGHPTNDPNQADHGTIEDERKSDDGQE